MNFGMISGMAAIAALGLALASAQAQQPAGAAERVDQGTEQRTFAARAVLNSGDTVYTNAVLLTDANGAASIRLQDGTQLTLSALSEIAIDAYVYDPAGSDRFAARMGVGILRFVSGQIAKRAVRIETPVVIVGVRGTDITLDTRSEGLARVWLEDGALVLTPIASGLAFAFQAPAQIICTIDACRGADLGAAPRAFQSPQAPRPGSQGGSPEGLWPERDEPGRDGGGGTGGAGGSSSGQQ